MPVRLNRDEFRNKMYGCWMGKNIGGTVGGPFEGRQEILDVTGYTTPAGEPLPNDDLDLQLVWLRAVQDRGPLAITNKLLGEYWLNYIAPFWNEYGVCKSNMRAGLFPPLSGEYENAKWKHSNGAWIRSEIWACLAPGCPDLAIRYAYADASVDHGGGEGTNAALFTAALESAAFIINDREELLRIALAKIPADCRVARSIGIARDAYAQGLPWQEARNRVVDDSADLGWFQAPANVAFVVIGWLYGEGDFGKSLLTAVNCGDDTDCTAATLGALLGILYGAEGIPAEWKEPIGERIVTVAVDRGSLWGIPATLTQLTDEVMAQTPISLAAHKTRVELIDGPTEVSDDRLAGLCDQQEARGLWEKSPYAIEFDCIHTKVVLDYLREPKVQAGVPFTLEVTLVNLVPSCQHAELSWQLPAGWQLRSPATRHISLRQHPTTETVSMTLLPPEVLPTPTIRGILEVTVQGRPTVGLIPLVFFAAE